MTTTKSVPSEKRQEERLIQKLRDFQRSQPPNKRCFDCNEMMPQYVCLDFNTFVCTACSGIHREFAHRVKSISMSKFTEKEVQQLIDRGGNEAAQKYWRSKHDPTFRPNGGNDGERTRNFIRLTYIDRKWVDEPAEDNESKRPSKKSSKKKVKNHVSDDIVVPSSAKLAPSTADSGFGDFSKFEGSSQTAATVARSFDGFGSFDDSAPDNKDTGDFTDFGDFEGSSGSTNATQKATSKIPTSSPVSNFSSFKMPPPPGSNINASNASKTIATEDLMGLCPPQQDNNPFGFDAPAPASVNASHPTPVDSSPFHFDAPTPTSNADGLSSAAFLDPLSDMTAAASPAKSTESSSPFDAFDPPLVSSSPVFDAFAAPSPVGGNAFGAVGGGQDAFGDFMGSTSSSRTDSVLDPFSSTAKHPAPTAADPFAAFENTQLSVETAPTVESAAPSFGPSTGLQGYNSVSLQQSVMEDPFGFVSGTDSNNSGFIASQQQQRSGTTSQLYGGFPQQQHPQNAYGMQMQQPMQLLLQGQPLQQQQQWYGQQQGFYGQQQLMQSTGQQYNGQFSPYVVSGAHPAPIPVKTPASVTTINDPFASLNIGNLVLGGTNDSTSGGTTNSTPATQSKMSASFGVAPTTPVPSGSFSYAQPQTRMDATFPRPTQNTTTFDAFGDFTSAPAAEPAVDSTANPFDMF